MPRALNTLAVLTILTAVLFTPAIRVVAGPSDKLTLWYDKPAQSAMNEALPIGNGRIGGLVFGGTSAERVVVNEDSLWTGDSNPSGGNRGMGAYQTLGDLHITLPGHDAPTAYRRDLDISQAVAHVSYQSGGIHYEREYFASHPDQAMVIRLTADKRGSYTGTVDFADGHAAAASVQGNTITCAAVLPNGMQYETDIAVLNDGGTVSADGALVSFTSCNSVTLVVTCGTSYVMDYARKYQGDNPHARVSQQLASAVAKRYGALKSNHVKDFQSLFNRVDLDLGSTSADRQALPTDRRKLSAAKGGDPELEKLLFQYGRYLLISCSRPGSLPANLQGLWNDSNRPPWNSDYHANINVEMNYWPAEVANLSECHMPLFDLIESQLPDWRKATQAAPEYALQSDSKDARPVRGFALRTSHNITGGMSWKWDKTANAWYAHHFWEHYAFTGDAKFLREVAYPILKETCEFWEDHLKTLPDGRLVVPQGWSPEHGPTEDGVSYNQEIVWDLFTNYIDASTVLNLDTQYRDRIRLMRDKLVGPKIGKWGQLQEWMEDIDDPNDHHRHTSNLFGLYPGRQFSVFRTPNLAAAAKISLVARGDTGDVREWSYAWRTALYARLHDGDDAHRQLDNLFTDGNSCPNLFGLHPPMQADGNFGITAGIAEMLLQSQDGDLVLLPALPSTWPTGAISGLCARGGFTVGMAWKDGKLIAASIRSKLGGDCRVLYGNSAASLKIKRGGLVRLDGLLRRNNS